MVWRYASYPFLATLLIFFLRRVLFAITVFLPKRAEDEAVRRNPARMMPPDILVLVPCRNEGKLVLQCCREVAKLKYLPGKWQVVLISDGSSDDTAEQMEREALGRPGWSVLKLDQNIGKAAALNAALKANPFGEIVYILDVDHHPNPNALRNIISYFTDSRVAGISGFTRVIDPTASHAAYYSTVESLVNQLVTMRAKDRLNLAPALLGSNCAYRREVLNQQGGFRRGAFSEDSDLTVTFYQNGYRVRFAEDVVSTQQVPQTVQGYMKQHIRWGRGLNDVARQHSLDLLRSRKLSLPLRLELLLFSAGYLDRLALIGTGIFTLFSYFIDKPLYHLSRSILFLSLLAPLGQVVALFFKERAPREMWLRLPLIPVFFVFDILAAARAMLDSLFNRRRVWGRTERAEL